MSIVAYLRSLVARFFHRSQTERELVEELHSHTRLRADALERSGLTRVEAERRARIEFGGDERCKEECRETSAGNFIDSLLRDRRYGTRMLFKISTFTFMAVATRSRGIGVNSAVFS